MPKFNIKSMTDQDLKKIKKVLKELVTPVKELVEITNHRVKKVETGQTILQISADKIKDQQSVMNEKLDEHTEKLDNHTAALMKIEDTLEGYADMYKVNKEDNERLEQRVEAIETQVGITSQE